MNELIIKFQFLKTPQLKYNFRDERGFVVFPRIKAEIFQARLIDGQYEFSGITLSGRVSEKDFNDALKDGFIAIIRDQARSL